MLSDSNAVVDTADTCHRAYQRAVGKTASLLACALVVGAAQAATAPGFKELHLGMSLPAAKKARQLAWTHTAHTVSLRLPQFLPAAHCGTGRTSCARGPGAAIRAALRVSRTRSAACESSNCSWSFTNRRCSGSRSTLATKAALTPMGRAAPTGPTQT